MTISINTEFVFSKQSLPFDFISDRVIDYILQGGVKPAVRDLTRETGEP